METKVNTKNLCAFLFLIMPMLVLLSLSGCSTPQGSAVLAKIATTGAEEADKALDVAIWGTCKAPTAGAITRKWGSDPVAFRKWAEFCDYVTFPIGGGS